MFQSCFDFPDSPHQMPCKDISQKVSEEPSRQSLLLGGIGKDFETGLCETISLTRKSSRYSTFAALANVDPTDEQAAAAGLPPIDSINVWPLLSGATTSSPRTEVHIGSNVGGDDANRTSGPTSVGGLIQPPWKILLGW